MAGALVLVMVGSVVAVRLHSRRVGAPASVAVAPESEVADSSSTDDNVSLATVESGLGTEEVLRRLAAIELVAQPALSAEVPVEPNASPTGGLTASSKAIPDATPVSKTIYPSATAPILASRHGLNPDTVPQSQPPAPANRQADAAPVQTIDATPLVKIESRFVEIRGSLPSELVAVFSSSGKPVRLTAAATRDLTEIFSKLEGPEFLSTGLVGTTHLNHEIEFSAQPPIAVIPGPGADLLLKMGPTLRVLANTSQESPHLIDLTANTSHIKILGYALASDGLTRLQIQTNLSSCRERIGDGQSVLMNAGAFTNRMSSNDKAAYLGRLPLVGRFFHKESARDQVSHLFVLVTSKLVDGAGKPIHDQ